MATVFDPRDFRRALGVFPTGVTVITTRDCDGTPRGFTANSFTSVSLDPPMILVCVAKTAETCPIFVDTDSFAVTILGSMQRPVSALFASKTKEKFSSVPWTEGTLGLPLIDGAAAWFACVREKSIDAGDHVILLGRVSDYSHTPDEPLGYCRGAYVDFALSQRAITALGRALRVEALLEQDDQLLMLRLPDGSLALPGGPALGTASDPDSLYGTLATLNLKPQLDFLFAIFERPNSISMNIVYRGTVTNASSHSGIELHPIGAVPVDRIADKSLQSMIKRYILERTEGFGVYVGNEVNGVVRSLT